MGFGPTLIEKQVGETTYRLALIPFGGYVRMAGQDDSGDAPAKDPNRGFSAKSLSQRAAIVAAGPLVNVVFAFVLYLGTLLGYGSPVASTAARVGEVLPDRPAARAGLIAGDTIRAIDGQPIEKWEQLVSTVRGSDGRELILTVANAEGAERTVTVKPEGAALPGGSEGERTWMIGIAPGTERRPVGLFEALGLAATRTWISTRMILDTLGQLASQQASFRDLGGPIMIAQEAARQAAIGFEPLLYFIALVSVNLGVINLVPIPVLDGGHLAFFAVELFRGRPLSLRVRERALTAGVFLLIGLMVLVLFNDISRNLAG
jgi:regulator of sigma E protease